MDPTPLTYEWDFGDDQAGDGTSPGHVYQSDGEYTVIMTAHRPLRLLQYLQPSAGGRRARHHGRL